MMKIVSFISVLLISSLSVGQIVHDYVVSQMNGITIMEDGTFVPIWGYGRYNHGGQLSANLPGPFLRYNYNDSVNIHFWNNSAEDHTIHLHGLDANQANDGVPSTSIAIDPQDSIVYKFRAEYTGTYLYHCHVTTTLHLTMGMYGMLVVDYPGNLLYQNGPGYNKEYAYLYSDMDRTWNFTPTSPGPFYLYDPTDFLLNGLQGTQLFTDATQIINAAPNDSILIRVGNVGYTISEYVFPEEMNASIEMSDGRPAPSPLEKDTLKVYPGERFSILLRPTSAYNGYIEVNSIDMFNDSVLYTNYIGINEPYHPTGIIDNSRKVDWSIYPNPNNGAFTIELSQSGQYNVYNIDGRLVKTFSLEAGSNQINLDNVENGVYFIVNLDTGLYKQFVISN